MINDLSALGVEPLLTNTLYGNERDSEQTNKIAFSAVQEFIKETSMFQFSMNIYHDFGFIIQSQSNLNGCVAFILLLILYYMYTVSITELYFCSVPISQSSTCKKAVT